MKVSKYVSTSPGQKLVMNLSAPFICQFFKEPLLAALPYADILTGNEAEALAFSEAHNLNTQDIAEIAVYLANYEQAQPSRGPRLVVITQGTEPVIAVHQGRVEKFEVQRMSKEDIVDTNGAGDAFVGGFLAQWVRDKDLSECVRCGIWAAQQIIRYSGCTFPDVCEYQS